MKTKVCPRCKKRKRVHLFGRRSLRQIRSWCERCEIESTLLWQKTESGRKARRRAYLKEERLNPGRAAKRLRGYRAANPLQFRDYELRRNYGITLREWLAIFAKQGKKCAICRVRRPNIKKQWFTDHNHRTKNIRGILCGYCNAVLGYSRDVISILQSAIAYLKRGL